MFKKISTLVCAMAIATSAFTGVVANAAVDRDQGVNLVGTKTADNKITVSVYAVGGYTTVGAVDLHFSVTGAEVDSVSADYAAISGGLYNVANAHLVKTTASSVDDVTLNADGLILTITFTLKENISEDVTITLNDECIVDDLEYYAEDLETDPSYVTLGFNDVVIKAPAPPAQREFNADLAGSQAFSTVDNYDKDMVVGQYTLTIKNGSYDLANAKYNNNASKAITDAEGNAVASTIITGDPEASAIVFVVLEGTDDVADLDNVVFE